MTASELFAIAHSTKVSGEDNCYYCAAPCKRLLLHDQPPPGIGQKRAEPAMRPGSGYLCIGCWLYRRPRVTVHFLRPEGEYCFKDGQCLKNHSWWLDESGVWGIDEQSHPVLWEKLLKPPLRFALALREGAAAPANLLQVSVANDLLDVRADTKMHFTVNNVAHTYTIYDIEEGMKQGTNGRESGVAVLFRMLGMPPRKEVVTVPKGKGRPRNEDRVDPKRLVKAALLSGGMAVK